MTSTNLFQTFFCRFIGALLIIGIFLLGRPSQGAELAFEYPTNGMSFLTNDPITVRIVAPTGRQFVEVRVKYPQKWVYEGVDTDPPYEFPIYLPLEVGAQRIVAEGKDQAGERFTAEVTVNLLPPSLKPGVTIQDLRVERTPLSFSYISQVKPLFVFATFSDGERTTTSNITLAIDGTTYQVQEGGDSVIEVSPNGQVTAKSNGEATILVSNNGLTEEVAVTVESINTRPELHPISDVTVKPGEVVEIQLTASDVDGDALSFPSTARPPYVELVDHGDGTATLRFAPENGDDGAGFSVVVFDDGTPRLRDSQWMRVSVIDPDVDKDGVFNGFDTCPGTGLGDIVDAATGCNIDQLCPCEGPRGTTEAWRNHWEYVTCVGTNAGNFRKQGLITRREKRKIIWEAWRSSCGRQKLGGWWWNK